MDSTRRRRQNAATGRVRRRSAGPGSSGDVLNVGALRHMNAMDFADETTVEFHSACAPAPGRGDGRADADFIGSQVGAERGRMATHRATGQLVSCFPRLWASREPKAATNQLYLRRDWHRQGPTKNNHNNDAARVKTHILRAEG